MVQNSPKMSKNDREKGTTLNHVAKIPFRRYHIIDHDIDRGLYYGREHMAYNFCER